MSMRCGAMYRHLIRSSAGGTPEDPCGWFCYEGDEAAWYNGARDLADRVRQAFAVLASKSPGRADNRREAVDAWLGRVSELPNTFEAYLGGGTPAEMRKRVDGTIMLMDEGVCLFERIQDDLQVDGHQTIPVPEGPPIPTAAGGWGIGTWIVAGVLTAGVAAGAWYGLSRIAVKESE